MSRRSIAVFFAAFALVSVVSLRDRALARYRRFHAAACSSHSASPTYGIPTDSSDPNAAKASGVLYSRTNGATTLVCAVTDSSEFKVSEMSVLRVVLNDASAKYASVRWCWSAMGGWTGACGGEKKTTGVAPAPSTTPLPPDAPPADNTTQVLTWDAKTVENADDAPWAKMRATGFPYVYVTMPSRATGDLSLGLVGYVVSDGVGPEPGVPAAPPGTP